MKQFSSYQQAAYDYCAERKGNFAIGAGPGSGKSTFIRKTVQELINKYGRGISILILQFNRHIREAMEAQLNFPNVEILTGHAAGKSLCEKYLGKKIQPNKDKYFYIVSRLVCDMYGVEKPQKFKVHQRKEGWALIKSVGALLSKVKKNVIDPYDDELLDDTCIMYGIECDSPAITYRTMRAAYEEGLEECEKGNIDFDDMITFPLQHEDLQGKKHDYVFIDETQDYGEAQMGIAMKFVDPDKTLVGIVGDHNQSIMLFAGARCGAMDVFSKMINAKKFPMPICYRCPSSHLDLARILVPRLEDSPNPPQGSVEFIDRDELINISAPGDAVLSRVTAPLVGLCMGYIARGKKAFVKGKEIGKEIADVIDAVNKLGGGKASYKGSLALESHSFQDDLIKWHADKMKTLEDSKSVTAEITKAKVDDIRDCIDILYRRKCVDEGLTIEEMKENIIEMFQDKDESNYVVLSSCHKAKGNEYDRVFLISEKLPLRLKGQTAEQFLQEVNLLYVAITRSKCMLYIVDSTGSGIKSMDEFINLLQSAANESKINKHPDNQPHANKEEEGPVLPTEGGHSIRCDGEGTHDSGTTGAVDEGVDEEFDWMSLYGSEPEQESESLRVEVGDNKEVIESDLLGSPEPQRQHARTESPEQSQQCLHDIAIKRSFASLFNIALTEENKVTNLRRLI